MLKIFFFIYLIFFIYYNKEYSIKLSNLFLIGNLSKLFIKTNFERKIKKLSLLNKNTIKYSCIKYYDCEPLDYENNMD